MSQDVEVRVFSTAPFQKARLLSAWFFCAFWCVGGSLLHAASQSPADRLRSRRAAFQAKMTCPLYSASCAEPVTRTANRMPLSRPCLRSVYLPALRYLSVGLAIEVGMEIMPICVPKLRALDKSLTHVVGYHLSWIIYAYIPKLFILSDKVYIVNFNILCANYPADLAFQSYISILLRMDNMEIFSDTRLATSRTGYGEIFSVSCQVLWCRSLLKSVDLDCKSLINSACTYKVCLLGFHFFVSINSYAPRFGSRMRGER